MLKVALVRGAHLNGYEGQNYLFGKRISITGISSRQVLSDEVPFPVIKLRSVTDISMIPFIGQTQYFKKMIKVISNRTLGDAQILFGLENYALEFDIFHTADPHYYYSYQLAKLRKEHKIKKLIVTSWETIPFNNETVSEKEKIKYFTMKYTDLFICYTQKAHSSLLKEGVDKSKIQVVHLGIDLFKFRPVMKKKKKYKTILFVGRLVEEKGVLELYEAFRTMLKETKHKNIKLKIIGEGPMEWILHELIEKDGLQLLVTIEKKSYQKIPYAYNEADIFILPSKSTKTWEEQYGMVLLEAMASGLPVIATTCGAIPEVMGDAGVLIAENNVLDLKKAIYKLIDNEKLRKKLGTMSRKRAEKMFNAKKTALQLEKIYNSL